RAAPGFRPRFELPCRDARTAQAPFLDTDRDLRVEGIDVRRDSVGHDRRGVSPAYLVYCTGGGLFLRDCTIEDECGAALVVCRDCRQAALEDCRLRAGAL